MKLIKAIKKGNSLRLCEPLAGVASGEEIEVLVIPKKEREKVAETLGWLSLTESAFDFWDNDTDNVWNNL